MARKKSATYDPLDMSVFHTEVGSSSSTAFDPLDMSAFHTPEAEHRRAMEKEQADNKDREIAAQVDAIAKDYESRGEPLRDSEIASLYQALSRGEDWTRPAPADFSNVTDGRSDVVKPEAQAAPSLIDRITGTYDYATNTYKAAKAQEELADIAEAEGKGLTNAVISNVAKATGLSGLLSAMSGQDVSGYDVGDFLTQQAREITAGVDASDGMAIIPKIASNFFDTTKAKERLAAEQAELDARKAKATKELGEASNVLAGLDPSTVTEGVVGSIASAAGQPEQLLPTAGALVGGYFGGPGGAAAASSILSIPMAQTAYTQAREQALTEWDATREEADLYGMAVAAVQVGSEAVGGPLESAAVGIAKRAGLKSLTKDAAKDMLFAKIRSRTSRVAGAAAVEAGEEVAATAGQDAIEKGMEVAGFFSSPEGQAALKEHNLENAATWGERYAQSALGGATVGGLITTPVVAATVRAEKGARAKSLERILGASRDAENTANEAKQEEEAAAVERNKAFDQVQAADEEKKRQDIEQATRAAKEQKSLEEEAGFQTLERPNGASATTVERTGRKGFADVVERVAAGAVQPEAVAEQRAAEQRAAQQQAEQEERVRKGKLAEELRARKERLAKEAEKKAKAEERSNKAAEKKRREFIADQVLADNPNATPAELTAEYERRLADEKIQPPKKKPAPTKPEVTLEERIAAVRSRLEGDKKRAITKRQNDRIKAVVRKNPDLSVEEIAESLRQEATPQVEGAPLPVTAQEPAAKPIPKATKPDANLDDKEVDDLVTTITGESLGMAAKGDTNTATPDRAARDKIFKAKAKKAIKAIAGRTTNDSTALQNLLRQGKVVVGLDAADLGREDSGNRAAEYDTATGKMYIYLNALDNAGHLNKPVRHIAAALHEATHALITPEEANAAAGIIRAAGNKGNKFAKDAVADARRDTEARRAQGEENPDRYENEEIVAYLANRVKEAEGKTLGTIGAAVRNLTAAAKESIRKNTGLDLKVTLNDVAYALQDNLNRAVQQDIKGRGTDDSLAMIYNQNSKGFDEAVRNGWVYESADGRTKYVLSDADAKLTPGAKVKLRDKSAAVKLGEVLDHSVLYNEHPEARNIPVYVIGEIPGYPSAFAQYDPNDQSIWITSDLVNETDARRTQLVEGLMHEIQHYIQDEGGYLDDEAYLDDPAITKVKEEFAEANNQHKIASRVFLDIVPAEASKQLSASEKRELSDIIYDRETNDQVKAAQAVSLLDELEVKLDGDAKDALDQFLERRAARRPLVDKYNQALATAHEDYLSNITEREAFRTQGDLALSEEDVRRRGSPEPQMREQDTADYPATAGRIDVPTRPFQERAREAAGTQSRSLGMAAAPHKVRRSTAVVSALPDIWKLQELGESSRKIFTGLTSNSKFLGHGVLESLEHARSLPAGAEAAANASLGKFDRAINKLALERGVDVNELSNTLMEELDAIDKESNSYSTNLAAYEAVASKYGEAGGHLMDLRNQVDNLTKEILRLWAASGIKPSASEAKAIKAMAANLGRYSHRLYAVHQGKAGKSYATQMMRTLNKSRKGKALTPKQQETADMMIRAAQSIIDNNLMIPDDAGIAELGGDRLIRLYKTWIGSDPRAVSLDDMRDALAGVRDEINGDSDRLQRTADEILKELIGLKDAAQPIATYYRGSKQNRGILQERERIPAELRAVMGEITDPGTRLLASVAKQAEFVARTKFLLEMRTKARPEDLQPPTAAGTAIVVDNKMERLTGEGYGPLEGYWVSPNMKSILADVRESTASFEDTAMMASVQPDSAVGKAITLAATKWAKVAGVSKRMQIVGNFFLQPLNFFGAIFMPLVNGNINPATYARGLSDAISIIRYEINPSRGLGDAEAAVKYGVTDSATVGELKGLPYEKIQELATLMAGKKPSQFFKVAKKVGITLQHSYAMADVWAKIANFHNEVNVLNRFNKLNGNTMTEEEIYRTAADITNRTNITYKRAMPLFKSMERGGFTAFGTYFYEVFRSQIANALQGLGETYTGGRAATPAAAAYMRARGLARLGGQAVYWSAATGLTAVLSSILFGDDDDDEWDKRSLFPDYMQNQDLYPVGVDENGKPVYFAVSRIDAIGPITDLMRQAMSGGLSAEDLKDELLNLYVKPRIVPQLWNAAQTIITDKQAVDPLVQEWTPEGYQQALRAGQLVGLENKTTKALTKLAESVYMPGTLNATRKSNPTVEAPIDSDTELGKIVASGIFGLSVAAKVAGGTFVKANPERSARTAAMDYSDYVSTARKDLAAQFHDLPNITDKEVRSKITDAIEGEEKRWNEVARVYRGMQKSGMSQEDINKALKEAKVEGSLLKQVKSQRFEPTVLSKKSFDSLVTRYTRDLSGDKKVEAEKKWKEAWDRLNMLKEGND